MVILNKKQIEILYIWHLKNGYSMKEIRDELQKQHDAGQWKEHWQREVIFNFLNKYIVEKE